ncbi:hypothetical protein ACH5RR_008497 [Cinchona calisaya]|uniref:Retrovirus-related Pol polyprotein from transposon TNT 1-94-like beta-barrel domain-containing protein n=1 Tax=Cinchona calisaya TaxID=153742 RepID=A0ABD3ABI9_9GENT
MTNDSGKLTSLVMYNGPNKICVGNGELLDISCICSTTLNVKQKQLSLSNVLVVLNMKHNLLSTSQLTLDRPYKFEFSYDGFLIKDRNTEAMIAKGVVENYSMPSLDDNVTSSLLPKNSSIPSLRLEDKPNSTIPLDENIMDRLEVEIPNIFTPLPSESVTSFLSEPHPL